jgi:hypothetical protein
VAHAVIDVLEMIEIEEQYRGLPARTLGGG